MMRYLRSLFEEIPITFEGELPNLPVKGIASDSRSVKAGYIFVAVLGQTVDGHHFIADAVRRGAVAVMGEKQTAPLPVPYIQVKDSRRQLAHLAASFYDFPARKLMMIGVTGTDGKTTVVTMIYEILKAAGWKVGMISTVNAMIGNQKIDTGFHVTTPDAIKVQAYLAAMVEAGLTHCILETTSHGWAQNRVDGCEFDIGVLTNITHEHLDQHGSFENYRDAKMRLFTSLEATIKENRDGLRIAVINGEDPSHDFIVASLREHQRIQVRSYGLDARWDIKATDVKFIDGYAQFRVDLGEKSIDIVSQLPGTYNVSNCLAAIGATVYALGIREEYAKKAIENFPVIPGRMEYIKLGQNFQAVVDFAHTPNALRKVLDSARNTHPRRIIAVFGSAGLRDREKRQMMAEISTIKADISILTAEDPRTESLSKILREMTAAAERSGAVLGKSLFVHPDRRTAIRHAVQLAEEGDIVLLCGKGHEQSMCFGEVEYPWDDRIALKAALAEKLGIKEPEMPFLPPCD